MDRRNPDELSTKEIVERWMGQSKEADKWHLKHTKLKRKYKRLERKYTELKHEVTHLREIVDDAQNACVDDFEAELTNVQNVITY